MQFSTVYVSLHARARVPSSKSTEQPAKRASERASKQSRLHSSLAVCSLFLVVVGCSFFLLFLFLGFRLRVARIFLVARAFSILCHILNIQQDPRSRIHSLFCKTIYFFTSRLLRPRPKKGPQIREIYVLRGKKMKAQRSAAHKHGSKSTCA